MMNKGRGHPVSYILAILLVGWLVWLNLGPYTIPSTIVAWGRPFTYRTAPLFGDIPVLWNPLALVGNCIVAVAVGAAAKLLMDSCISDVRRMLGQRRPGGDPEER